MATVKELEELAELFEPDIRDAFLDSIEDIKDNATIKQLTELIKAGNTAGVIEALGLEAVAFQAMDLAIINTYVQSGISVAAGFPSRVKIVFNARNRQAEEYIRNHSSNLITEIVEDQKEMVREHLTDGLEKGQGPRQTALELVGRIDKGKKERTGGVIGLTSGQAEWQRAYALEIASDNPTDLRKALKRGLRDKRFDRSIKKAIREGTTIPASIQAKMRTAYRNKTLKYRADVIARHESIDAIGASNHEAYRQAIAKGELRSDQITKEWSDSGDGRVRHSHKILDDQKKAFDEPFVSPLGSRMLYPRDRSMGARKEDLISCRCLCNYRVKFE